MEKVNNSNVTVLVRQGQQRVVNDKGAKLMFDELTSQGQQRSLCFPCGKRDTKTAVPKLCVTLTGCSFPLE